ncbi:MAG: acetolactate synthase large subunit, partial [Hyphomicrobiales bacterium]|nr:acetolactate synthase large subunit [Hyphomicrobiales bacterium]
LSWAAAPARRGALPLAKRARARFDREALDAFAHALKRGRKAAILLGGEALRPDTLETASAIAAATGARLAAPTFCENLARGDGRPAIDRVPYFPDPAEAFLAGLEAVAVVGGRAPVNFFGYPGKASLPLPPRCRVLAIAERGDDVVGALGALARAVGAIAAPRQPPRTPPPAPAPGKLDDHAVGAVVARAIPADAIVVEEALTSAPMFFAQSQASARHDYLQLTGGAIGAGLPLALGAGMAARGRKVVALQADGSAMYTVQALWSMARENVDATVVVFSNRAYRILYMEMTNAGAPPAGVNARAMFDLDRPPLDFAAMATGMGVPATRVDTLQGFAEAFGKALKAHGPRLIEAVV